MDPNLLNHGAEQGIAAVRTRGRTWKFTRRICPSHAPTVNVKKVRTD